MHIKLKGQLSGSTSRISIGAVVRVDQWQMWDQTDTHTRFICCSHFASSYLDRMSYFTLPSLSNSRLFRVNQAFTFPTMDFNRPASSEDISDTNRKRKHLNVSEKMRVLAMINEGKSHADIARLFGVGRRTISCIKKARSRIRKTADINLNKSAKNIISPHHEPHTYMEASLVTWILNCRKNNIVLKA